MISDPFKYNGAGYVKELLKDIPLNRICKRDIEIFHTRMEKIPTTANRVLAALSVAFEWDMKRSVAALDNHEVDKIVLCRPAVEAGESLGFLPGDLKEKIDPYLTPLYDALGEMLNYEKLKPLLANNTIEIIPLAYMRGRTLNNAFMILDEAQNASSVQMKMFLTRLGVNSKTIITGDVTQTDLPKKLESGLIQVLNLLKGIDGIGFCELSSKDIVRHKLVKDIIKAYDEGKN